MRNIVFCIAIFSSLNSFSQVEKGKTLVGGYFDISLSSETVESTIGAGTIKIKNPSSFEFRIEPYFGKMISDNSAIGIRFAYNFFKTIDFDYFGTEKDNIIKQNLFYISPYTRYYKNLGEKLFMFTEAVMHFGTGTQKQKKLDNSNLVVDDEPLKYLVLSPQLGLGFNYFISKKYALELYWAGMYYNYTEMEKTYPDSYQGFDEDVKQIDKSFNLNLNFDSISLGIAIYL